MERKKYDDTASLTAQACNVTANYVRKVVKGERSNQDILNTYNKLKAAKEGLIETVLSSK